jgi:hypothetical protein
VAVYKNINNDSRSIFSSVDFDDAHNTAFSIVRNEVDVEKAKEILASAGEKFVAQSYVKGQTVLITQGKLNKKELFDKISTVDGDKFEIEPEKKGNSLELVKKHGWKLRGGSSIVGQSMTLFSSLHAPDKNNPITNGKLNTKFEPSIGAFASLNLAANFINLVFGGQKEDDVKGLEKFNKIIADEINHYLPHDANSQISPDDVHKLSYMSDKEVEEHNKDRSAAGVLKRNSVRLGEVGLRTLGSLALILNYKTVGKGVAQLAKGEAGIKEAWNIAKTPDDFTRIAGYGMVAGKAMGLAAQTYDPKDPPKTYWGELRQKALWRLSSFTEMISQGSLVYDRAKNKKIVLNNELKADNIGAAGNVLLTVPAYPARLVLPYGQKILDIPEVQARLLDELPKIPKDKIPEVAARVTARMVEYLGEDSPDFSKLYKILLDKLDKYHGVQALPHRVAGNGVAASNPQPDVKFADKIQPVNTEIPKHSENTAKDRIKNIIKDGSSVDYGHVAATEHSPSDANITR